MANTVECAVGWLSLSPGLFSAYGWTSDPTLPVRTSSLPAVMETPGLVFLTVALLGLLRPCLTKLTPRVSFPAGEFNLPRVFWRQTGLFSSSGRLSFCSEPTGSAGRFLTRFSSHEASNTTTLLLSHDGDTLYVGARDAVLALDVSHSHVVTLRTKVSPPLMIPHGMNRSICWFSLKGKLLLRDMTHAHLGCIYTHIDICQIQNEADTFVLIYTH